MKKGFTLIEMIGSIVILAIIALVAFPAVLNMLNSSQVKVDDGMKKYAKGAAKEYVNDHVNDFPRNSSLNKNVSINKLISEGYMTEKSVNDNMKNDNVEVTTKTNTINGENIVIYDYTYIEVAD